jgi:hypothetical protein
MKNERTTSIRHEVLLAAAIMASPEETPEGPPSIEHISSLLFELKKSGIDLGEIALRRVPEGFYSEDIETLIGHYLAAGYATQLSPVTLTPRGRQALAEIIAEERKENPEGLQRIEAVLGSLAA